SRREDLVATIPQCKREQLRNLRRVVDKQDAAQPDLLLARSGARQTRLLSFAWLQVHDPHPPSGGVISTMVVFDHRAPRLQSAHREGVALEVIARVIEHFIGVPVVGKNGIAPVYTHHGVVAVKCRFRAHVAARSALLAFADNITFLRFRSRRSRRRSCFSVHTVSATAVASAADAILTRFFASAACSNGSGSSTPIIRHCSLANFCKVAICSACRWPKRPCNFRYSDTGRMLCGRKL